MEKEEQKKLSKEEIFRLFDIGRNYSYYSCYKHPISMHRFNIFKCC